MTEPDTRPVTAPLWALDRFLSYAAADGGWSRTDKPELGEAWDVLIAAKDAVLGHPAPAAAGGPPLPDGIWGRVELPGMRSDTGWITEGTRGGQCVLVVRDWNGCPLGEYILGPACRLVHLPTPLRRPDPEPLAALPAGSYEGYYDEPGDEDDSPADAFPGHRGPDETAIL